LFERCSRAREKRAASSGGDGGRPIGRQRTSPHPRWRDVLSSRRIAGGPTPHYLFTAYPRAERLSVDRLNAGLVLYAPGQGSSLHNIADFETESGRTRILPVITRGGVASGNRHRGLCCPDSGLSLDLPSHVHGSCDHTADV